MWRCSQQRSVNIIYDREYFTSVEAHGFWSGSRRCWSIAEPHTGTAAVHVNELDAGRFKRAPDHIQRGAPRFRSAFELANGHHTHTRTIGKLLLRPIEKSPRGAALC